jgi:hypothetical protein
MNVTTTIFTVAACLLGAVLLGFGLLKLVQWLSAKYPGHDALEAALTAYIHQAIMFAYKQSEIQLDAGQARLHGWDKSQIASWLYNALPETILIGKVRVPLNVVKQLITQDQWATLVQKSFDQFEAWFDDIQRRFDDEVEKVVGGVG